MIQCLRRRVIIRCTESRLLKHNKRIGYEAAWRWSISIFDRSSMSMIVRCTLSIVKCWHFPPTNRVRFVIIIVKGQCINNVFVSNHPNYNWTVLCVCWYCHQLFMTTTTPSSSMCHESNYCWKHYLPIAKQLNDIKYRSNCNFSIS